MFLNKNKKADLVMQFVILVVIAVLMIFVVTAFGAKIWDAFFPSGDKATQQSFDALFNLMQTKSLSNKNYESTQINVYTKDGYRMAFFPAGDNKYMCGGANAQGEGIYVFKPDNCAKDKSCLCMYKDDPLSGDISTSTKKRNENLVVCKAFDGALNVENFDMTYYDASKSKSECQYLPETNYQTFIVSEEKRAGTSSSTKVLNVWVNSDVNIAKDAKLNKPLCGNTDQNDACYGRRGGDPAGPALDSNTPANFDKVYAQCKKENSNNKVYQSTCKYDPANNQCSIDCTSNGVVCSEFKSCNDYMNMGQGLTARYMTNNDISYAICKSDPCNINADKGCIVAPSSHYACTSSSTGEALSSLSSDCAVSSTCNAQYINAAGFTNFIKSYDTKGCSRPYYEEVSAIYACKSIYNKDQCDQELQQISKNVDGGCDFKLVKDFNGNLVTGLKDPRCEQQLQTKFEPVSFCNDPNFSYQVVKADLKPEMTQGTDPVCVKYTSTSSTIATAYKCKKQTINMYVEVKNTGDYDLTLAASPDVLAGGEEMSISVDETSPTVAKGQDANIDFDVDLTSATQDYTIYPGIDCENDFCQSNLNFKSQSIIKSDHGMILTPIQPAK